MAFRVIEGGRTGEPSSFVSGETLPSREAVLAEAERRIRATGYETWRNRERLTGTPVPRDIGYLAMQIRYVADAISGLADIPADYRSDTYWPV